MSAEILSFYNGRGGVIRTHDPLLPKPSALSGKDTFFLTISLYCIIGIMCCMWQFAAIIGHYSDNSRHIYGTAGKS